MRVTHLEKERLSDGGLLTLTKLGRTYSVMRGFTSLYDEPEITRGLNKNQAEETFITYLKNDILED